MIGKYFDGTLPCPPDGDRPSSVAPGAPTWRALVEGARDRALAHYRAFELDQAADAALSIIRAVDASINETQPFKLAKDPANLPEVGAILACCAQGVRAAAALLQPILITKADEVLASYGGATPSDLVRDAAWGTLAAGTTITKCAPFMRVDAPPA
jgi:methionyl-tRNA synthetase